MKFIPKWMTNLDWESVLFLFRGSDYVWERRLKHFRKQVEHGERRVAFRERLEVLKANRRPIKRQTSRNAGVFDPEYVPWERTPAPMANKSSQPPTTETAETAVPTSIRTAFSGDKPILAPRNFLPVIQEVEEEDAPANDTIVPLHLPTPCPPSFWEANYPPPPPKAIPADRIRFDGECQSWCRITPEPELGVRPCDIPEIGSEYPSTASVATAKASNEPEKNACTDTIAHVLNRDSPEMVGLGRWRHHKDISIKALEELIQKELRGPGFVTLFNGHRNGMLEAEHHPLVIEHRERLAATRAAHDQAPSTDTSNLYAIKAHELRPTAIRFRRMKDGLLERRIDRLVFEKSKRQSRDFESPLPSPSDVSISAGTPMLPGTKRRDSPIDSDLATLATISSSLATPDPRVSRLARAVEQNSQTRAKKTLEEATRRSRSVNQDTTELTRIISADPQNHVRWAQKLARTIAFEQGDNTEEAIADTDDEADDDILRTMQPLTRMRAFAAPDQRLSGSSCAISSGAVTPLTDSPQAGPSVKSTPPTSVERGTAASKRKLKVNAKMPWNVAVGSVKVDRDAHLAQNIKRRPSALKKGRGRKMTAGHMPKSVTFAAEISTFPCAVKEPPEQASARVPLRTVMKPIVLDETPRWATPPSNYALKPVLSREMGEPISRSPHRDTPCGFSQAKAVLYSTLKAERGERAADV